MLADEFCCGFITRVFGREREDCIVWSWSELNDDLSHFHAGIPRLCKLLDDLINELELEP